MKSDCASVVCNIVADILHTLTVRRLPVEAAYDPPLTIPQHLLPGPLALGLRLPSPRTFLETVIVL
jgi:hypothetical protein